MKTVMTFGTFDLLHPGHEYFLKQAKKFGNYLIVIIARDKTVKKVKGKLPRHSEKQRQLAVKALNLADKVVLGAVGDKYRLIRKYRPDIIALGYDQTAFVNQLKKKVKSFNLKTKVIRLKPYRPNQYKTSLIKNEKNSYAFIRGRDYKTTRQNPNGRPKEYTLGLGLSERTY